VALPRCRRHSCTLTAVWAVGNGSGRWTKVVDGGGHGRCGGAVTWGGRRGG
jgi:hypothetical protein